MDNNETLLAVKDLRVSFGSDEGEVRAVDGVSFTMKRGETLALGRFANLGFTAGCVLASLRLLRGGCFSGQTLLGLDLFETAGLGAFGFANLARLDHSLALGFALLHGRIIGGRPGAEFLDESLTSLGGGSLTVLVILSG